jgi:anionic cell wall polymer biosynthesis LytR-Cps2A-Psr (LCP) family protein
MVASLDLTTNQVTFISVPRDLWLDDMKAKVNAAYENGQEKNGNGLENSKKSIGTILGLTIQYGVRLDFSGFQKAVDQVGGVDVDVENTFDDYRYPITGKENELCGFTELEKDFSSDEAKSLNIQPGKRKVLVAPDGKIATDSADPEKGEEYFSCRYEHIHFDKGVTHMDGTTALKYVRSRHGLGVEGSDFARSRRQQRVIEAFRSKALSLQTLANPLKIKSLIDTFGSSFETDIPIDDMIKLFTISKKISQTQSIVLSSDSKNGLLINPPLSDYGGAWVLVPRTKNYTEIQSFIKQTLEGGQDATNSARPSNR